MIVKEDSEGKKRKVEGRVGKNREGYERRGKKGKENKGIGKKEEDCEGEDGENTERGLWRIERTRGKEGSVEGARMLINERGSQCIIIKSRKMKKKSKQ